MLKQEGENMKKIISIILSIAMVLSFFGAFSFTTSAASMTDSTFFSKFNYSSYPALSAVKAAVDSSDYEKAKEELVNYFIERKANGEVSAFDITEADENYGMAVLPLDNILTGPYEFDTWLNRFTVSSKNYAQYSIDITEKTSQELNNQAISVMLFERQKQAYPVIVASKEMAGYEPVLVVETAEGDVYNIKPDNDTYIHSGNTSTTYGSETELYVKEQSDSLTSPFGSQTRRAYINFPLDEAANKTVTKATLKLYAKLSSDCTAESLDVHVLSVGDTLWDEDTLCWSKIGGNIYSYQNASVPTWQQPSGADSEYQNVTSRFWYARAMAYEYLTYLDDPEGYASSHPLYPDGSVFGEKLIELMDAFASQVSYGFNRTLETGERLNRWVDVIDALVDTPAVKNNPDKFANIISFMWGDCNYLSGLDITNGSYWWSNWRIVANTGFFKAVEYLPEFSTYSSWRNKVEGNVEYTLNLLFNDDMSFTEAGPAYAVWCAQLFGECARIAELNNHPMSKSFTEKLRYAARYAAESIYPDGYDSNIGDSNYKNQMSVFKNLNDFYNGDSILDAFVNGTDEGNPEYYSSVYNSSNTIFMRNSWNPDEAVYMQFENNPSDGHAHPDSNQVIMYAYGKPLLVDSGRYSYSSFNSIYNELRWASAHNTIEAVGKSMSSHSSSANALENTTVNNAFSFATSTQNGYSGVNHTRNVLYLNEGFGIVTDYIEGSDSSQEYRQNWHFMPSSNATMDGLTAKTDFYKEANITVASASADSAQIRDGYHSADYGLVAGSKYASYSKSGANVKFDTVLYPTKAGESADVSVTDLADGDNSKAAIKVNINGSDYYYYVKNTESSDGKIADYYTDAKMLLESENTFAMAEGTEADGTIGVKSKNNIKSISIKIDGNAMYIEGESLVKSTDKENAVEITSVSGITNVFLNGEEVDFYEEDGDIYAVKSTDITGSGDVSTSLGEYKIIGTENLISNGDFSDGVTGWTNASNGEDIAITPTKTNAHEYSYSITNTASAGGSAASTLRRFIEVEPGKSYYLSYYAYSTAKTTANGQMSAAVLTSGGPVYGSFNSLSYYNYNIYGGMNSWSAESNTQVGGSISRSDDLYESGMNHKEFVFDVPEGATHLMLSFFAWTATGQLYLSDFTLYEAEKLDDEEETTVTAYLVDEDGNEIADSITSDCTENNIYLYDAPESVTFNDGYYVLDESKSLLSAKIKKGTNTVKAVYKKTGLVTVKFAKLDGTEISPSVTYEAEIGSEFNGAEKAKTNIVYDSNAYLFVPSSTDKITVSEKISENSVTLYYNTDGETFDGMLAYFTFDDEESGFSSEFAKATSNGTNSLSTDAVKGNSLYLNGSGSNYLNVTDIDGNSLLTGLDEATITFYAKHSGTSWPLFIAPNADAQSYPYEHYVGILFNGSNVTVERYNNNGARPATIAATTAENTWKRYTLVIKENSTILYVDGVATELSSSYKLTDILGSNSVFQIGKANWGSGEFFTGYIDEFAIYNRALTEQEINAIGSASKVFVKYVDENGKELIESKETSLISGAQLTEAMIDYDRLIEVNGTFYMVDSIDGIGSVGDGKDITVTVKYVEAIVTESTLKANKGDSLNTGAASTSGFASETDTSTYDSRLMTDHRWYYRAGLVGFNATIPEGEEVVSAVVRLHVNASSGTSGAAIYSASSLSNSWERGSVSNFDLPEEAIAMGTYDGEYMEFDVSDYVYNENLFDFALFTTTSQEYIIYDSENTSYVPELIIKTASPKKTRFEIVGDSAVYTSFDGENATVSVSYYDSEGKLIKTVTSTGNGDTVSVAIEKDVAGAVTYKALVWKSLSSLKPIFEPINGTLE
jgi:hypothetical protein